MNKQTTINDLEKKEQELNILLEEIEKDNSKICNIYKVFKASNSILSYSYITKDYLDKCDKLVDTINTLIEKDLNPFECWNLGKHRKYKHYKMDDRGTDVANDKDIKETMIQRHLMKSNAYENVIGKVIGYEVTIPGDYARKFPIDLISYKKDKKDKTNLSIYLIELKKCKFNENGSDSKEIILRSVSEIATYYQVFKAAINCDDDGLAQELADRIGGNTTINYIRNAAIYKVIIGPEDMINDKSILIKKGIKLNTYKFMSIESIESKCEFSMYSKEKLFEIKEKY